MPGAGHTGPYTTHAPHLPYTDVLPPVLLYRPCTACPRYLVHHDVLPVVLGHCLDVGQQDLVAGDNHGELGVDARACTGEGEGGRKAQQGQVSRFS